MENRKLNICVFCSSSNTLDEIYYKEADLLGKLLAENGFNLVYGGSRIGTMYSVANSAKQYGSKIYGVMPERLYGFNVSSDECDEFYLTLGMRERKDKLDELSDGIIAMPGGFGTLEEVSEMICHKQLGYNNKPIVFLNTNGFYDDLIRFFDNICSQNFAKASAKEIYYIANTPKEAVDYLLDYSYEYKEVRAEDIYTSV